MVIDDEDTLEEETNDDAFKNLSMSHNNHLATRPTILPYYDMMKQFSNNADLEY